MTVFPVEPLAKELLVDTNGAGDVRRNARERARALAVFLMCVETVVVRARRPSSAAS